MLNQLKETICIDEESMLKSTEYDRFKFFWWNRDIPKSNLKKIKESMLADGGSDRTFPITVVKRGNDYYIADGQTRFTAAKELGFIIYYIVADIADPYDDNAIFLKYTGRNDNHEGWAGKTFLETKIKIGNESAIWMGNMLEQYSWLTFTCLETLIDSDGKTFVNGDVGNGFNKVDDMLRSHVSEFVIDVDTMANVEDTLAWVDKTVKGCKKPSRTLLAAITYFKYAENGPIRTKRLNTIVKRNWEEIKRYHYISDLTEFLTREYFRNNKLETGEIRWSFKGKKKTSPVITINNQGGTVNIYNS